MSIAIQCSSCGTTSQIPTSLFVERFRGRKTSVRCKRCLGAIVVDDTMSVPKLEAELTPGSSSSLRAVEVNLAPLISPEASPVASRPAQRSRGALVSLTFAAVVGLGALYAVHSRAPRAANTERAVAAEPVAAPVGVPELVAPRAAIPASSTATEPASQARPTHDERALGFALRWGIKQADLCHARGGSAARTVVVDLKFEPTGKVSRAALNGEEAPSSAEDRCILGQFRSAMIPRFVGEPVAISREIKLR